MQQVKLNNKKSIFSREKLLPRLTISVYIKKLPGPNKILARMQQELSWKAVLLITYICNVSLTLRHFSISRKKTKTFLILKSEKLPEKVKSYRPISLLSIIFKLPEKMLRKMLFKMVEINHLIPDY